MPHAPGYLKIECIQNQWSVESGRPLGRRVFFNGILVTEPNGLEHHFPLPIQARILGDTLIFYIEGHYAGKQKRFNLNLTPLTNNEVRALIASCTCCAGSTQQFVSTSVSGDTVAVTGVTLSDMALLMVFVDGMLANEGAGSIDELEYTISGNNLVFSSDITGSTVVVLGLENVNMVEAVGNYSLTEQTWPFTTHFGDTISWRTWDFGAGAEDPNTGSATEFKDLVGLASADISRVVRAVVSYLDSGTAWQTEHIPVLTDQATARVIISAYTTSTQRLVTVWYKLI